MAGYGPAAGDDGKSRSSPYPTGPLPSGPLQPGAVKPAAEEAAPAAAAPAASVPPAAMSFFPPEFEKSNLVKKLFTMQQTDSNCKSKWWSFCKAHGEGNFDAAKFDAAFLLTFFEALELGDIPDEPGNPYTQQQGGWQGGWDSGAGQDGGAGEPNKIFVGGLPKATTTEADVWKHFGAYGTVSNVLLKYDPEGGFRGFGFVTFQDAATAQMVLNDNGGRSNFQGRWIDSKPATGTPGGKGDKGGSDKGKGGKGWDKGGKGWDKGGKGWDKGGKGWDKGGYDKGKGKKGDGKSGWGGGGGYGGSKGSKDGGKGHFTPPGEVDETRAFIGGLPKTATNDGIYNFFSQFGQVKDVQLKFDDMGTFRGFGYISFASADAVQAAINNGSNNIIDGKWVDVKSAAARSGGKGGKEKGGKDKGKGKGDKGGGKQALGYGDWGAPQGGCQGGCGW